MLELNTILQEKGKDYISKLFSRSLVISERLDGSILYVKRNEDKFDIYKRDSDKPISLVDRVLMKYYDSAINYFNSFPSHFFKDIPHEYKFCFKYIINNKPINTFYDKIPKNNLVLTHIQIDHPIKKIIDDKDILDKWADLFNVEGPPIIFKGILDSSISHNIITYLCTSKNELKNKFGTDSFTEYLIKQIKPESNGTFLNNTFAPIDSIIFKFIGNNDNETVTGKVIDYYLNNTSIEQKKDNTDDYISFILIDFIEFIEQYPDLINAGLFSKTVSEKYIELISELFNKFIELYGYKYDGILFKTPEFAKIPEFNLNTDFIKNEKTKELINSSELYKEIYKLLIINLRKIRKKTNQFLTLPLINALNNIVNRIKKVTEIEVNDNFVSFSDYIKLKDINESFYINETNNKELYIGNTFPITTKHIEIFESLYEKNKSKIIFLTILDKNSINKTTLDLFESLISKYEFVDKIIYLNNVNESYIKELIKSYNIDTIYLDNNKYNMYYSNVFENINIKPIKNISYDTTYNIVKNSLEIKDEKSFFSVTPKELHCIYNYLNI